MTNKQFDESGKQRPDKITEIEKEVREKMKYYTSEEILSKGREFVMNEDYIRALFVFNELYKTDKERIAELYNSLILVMTILKADEDKKLGLDNIVTEKTIDCMKKASNMYMAKVMQKEDLFNIESIIDRIPFENISIKNNAEFKRIYSKFKEYCVLNIFIGEHQD